MSHGPALSSLFPNQHLDWTSLRWEPEPEPEKGLPRVPAAPGTEPKTRMCPLPGIRVDRQVHLRSPSPASPHAGEGFSVVGGRSSQQDRPGSGHAGTTVEWGASRLEGQGYPVRSQGGKQTGVPGKGLQRGWLGPWGAGATPVAESPGLVSCSPQRGPP